MIGCKYTIYWKIDFVLDRSQFKKLMGKTIYTSKQAKTIDQLSNQGQATYPRVMRLRQSKQFI